MAKKATKKAAVKKKAPTRKAGRRKATKKASKPQESKSCFILSALSSSDSAIRSRADKILKHILEPVLDSNGYTPMRADKMQMAGMITTQIINAILESDLVVADLTGGNSNVFYELALRHASRLPYIQIIEADELIPFDIHGVRTVQFDHTDLDSVENAKTEIAEQIAAFQNGHTADSPVSIASDIRLIQRDSRFAEQLLEELRDLDSSISNLEENIPWEVEGSLDSLIDSAKEDICSKIDDRVDEAISKIGGIESQLENFP